MKKNETFDDAYPSMPLTSTNDCLIDLFEKQVEKWPDSLALIYKEEKITYYTLNARANQAAHFLQSKGVQPEVRVPICIERGVEMMVWILGILKAGGAYVPIDPSTPVDRITFLLNDLEASLLVIGKAAKSKLAGKVNLEFIEVEEMQFSLTKELTENLHTSIQLHDLAYIIYTSGSTGAPKGVMIEHHSLANYLLYCKA